MGGTYAPFAAGIGATSQAHTEVPLIAEDTTFKM